MLQVLCFGSNCIFYNATLLQLLWKALFNKVVKSVTQIPEITLLVLCDLGFWFLCIMIFSLIILAYSVVSKDSCSRSQWEAIQCSFHLPYSMPASRSQSASSPPGSAYETIHSKWFISTRLTAVFEALLVTNWGITLKRIQRIEFLISANEFA